MQPKQKPPGNAVLMLSRTIIRSLGKPSGFLCSIYF